MGKEEPTSNMFHVCCSAMILVFCAFVAYNFPEIINIISVMGGIGSTSIMITFPGNLLRWKYVNNSFRNGLCSPLWAAMVTPEEVLDGGGDNSAHDYRLCRRSAVFVGHFKCYRLKEHVRSVFIYLYVFDIFQIVVNLLILKICWVYTIYK